MKDKALDIIENIKLALSTTDNEVATKILNDTEVYVPIFENSDGDRKLYILDRGEKGNLIPLYLNDKNEDELETEKISILSILILISESEEISGLSFLDSNGNPLNEVILVD